ncbi:unnamed protein product [Pleuronectes platessa]|uniref:Uncharacterized protein n=1 Tax=Pleuronectes platessa TaxID=8262 RepID=A0A9N7TJQ1_PLEPL|nr:unnamed protein product [Pleuronectes platessa]
MNNAAGDPRVHNNNKKDPRSFQVNLLEDLLLFSHIDSFGLLSLYQGYGRRNAAESLGASHTDMSILTYIPFRETFVIAAFICISDPAVTLMQVFDERMEQLLPHLRLLAEQAAVVKSNGEYERQRVQLMHVIIL